MLDSDSRAVRALPSFREASFRLALALAFALGLSFGVETRDIRALRHDLEKASNGKKRNRFSQFRLEQIESRNSFVLSEQTRLIFAMPGHFT